MAALIASCGGDEPADLTPEATQSLSASTAGELVPNLTDLGLRRESGGQLPTLGGGQDAYLAMFVGSSDAVSSVRVEISLFASAQEAATRFAAIAEALRNPPPNLFGAGASQVPTDPVYDADAERSYVTSRPDSSGSLVYSDAYQMGRAVVIVYTLGSDSATAQEARRVVAHRIDARAPR